MTATSNSDSGPVLEIDGITKRFGDLVANDGISLSLGRGEVLALLGENGAGKTTLMNILFGHYTPDAGSIAVEGRTLPSGSPAAAIEASVGMVHQHFTLADNLTVLDNVMLGTEPLAALRQRTRRARERLATLAQSFGLAVNPGSPVGRLSVGERQRVEILKALFRGARILILDEPTAVLTPQESATLFQTLRGMVAQGMSVIFISHKLNEVLEVADRVAVLRHGRLVATFDAEGASRASIAQAMVGAAVPEPKRTPMPPGEPRFALSDVTVRGGRGRSALDAVSLTVRAHEIVGIAGVSGNGQSSLAALIAGLGAPDAGTVTLYGRKLDRFSPSSTVRNRVGRIPEDRHHVGVIGDMSVSENLLLERYRDSRFARQGWLRFGAIRTMADTLIERYDVRGARAGTAIRTLSGGNMQKVILARVLDPEPDLILANQPTRGLDVGAAAYVHGQLFEARRRGAGIVLISEDLEELLALSDRIVVMYDGRMTAPLAVEDVTIQKIGQLMGGHGWEGAVPGSAAEQVGDNAA